MSITVPDWGTYPDEDWESITPEEAGLDPNGLEKWVAGLHVRGATFGGEDHSGDKYGAVLTAGGTSSTRGETGSTLTTRPR